ncbi:MAG: L-xylulose/3-keto-L-gulonate kinase [Firmicutes bacterium ADurb.Bin182]|nr:MAG: L-xylulose/3-keto-L-gulonate kinase [Firmicutes bacterium ADurb.Bin182]
MKYYVGLDNGGTTIKAALYDLTGRELAKADAETIVIKPRPDFIERDMDMMWEANCRVLRELLNKSNIDPKDIAALACCGHGKGLYLWGKYGPNGNAILSTDNRAWEYPIRWQQDGTQQRVFEKTWQHILACQPVSLLAWMRDNEPERLRDIRWIFSCKDYIRFRLTGEAFAEITDSSGCNLVNLRTRQYDHELLGLFGLEFIWDFLPPLRNSTDILGRITPKASAATGLIAGTPVAGGMFDVDACCIAVGAANMKRVCMIAGTWSINEYIRSEPVTDGSILLNSIFCDPRYYLIEESSATSAGNNEWFIQTLMPELRRQVESEGRSVYTVLNDMAASIPAEEFCPVFLPFLMASNVHPNAKACFVGMSSYHTRAHIVRGIYEGIAFCHRFHFEKLMATRDVPLECIRLAGGVARSREWVQIFADVMGYPVETVETEETGTLGCAIAAAVAVGDYTDYENAAMHMVRVNPAVHPIPAHVGIYNNKYSLYRRILEALDPVWGEMQALL